MYNMTQLSQLRCWADAMALRPDLTQKYLDTLENCGDYILNNVVDRARIILSNKPSIEEIEELARVFYYEAEEDWINRVGEIIARGLYIRGYRKLYKEICPAATGKD